MPGPNVHLLICSHLLDSSPALAEAFDTADPRLRSALSAGAIAPDMGYYPGGTRYASDLCHYIRSGELARRLFCLSKTPSQIAFACGWASHVIADAAFHPTINAAAGEWQHKDRKQPATYADDPDLHVRVEVGLDAWLLAESHPETALAEPLDPDAIAPLRDAYAETYHVAVDMGELSRLQTLSAKWLPRLLAVERNVGRRMHAKKRSMAQIMSDWVILRPAAEIARLAGVTAVQSIVACHPPAPWLVEDTVEAVGAVAEQCGDAIANRLAKLPDNNLDTGDPADADPSYPPARATIEKLMQGTPLTRGA